MLDSSVDCLFIYWKLLFRFAGGKRPGKQALRVVLKKSKVGVAGSDEMRNAEIHMNRRLQVCFSCLCANALNVTLLQFQAV